MSEHFKGRLTVAQNGTIGNIISDCDEQEPIAMTQMRAPLGCRDPERKANARRLTAAWNACQGISTEALEAIPKHGGLSLLLNQCREALDADLENAPSPHEIGRLHALLKTLCKESHPCPTK